MLKLSMAHQGLHRFPTKSKDSPPKVIFPADGNPPPTVGKGEPLGTYVCTYIRTYIRTYVRTYVPNETSVYILLFVHTAFFKKL